jgi:hypothetical protein
MNEQALMQILLEQVNVIELLLEDHLRMARAVEGFAPNTKLTGMIPTIRVLRQRVQAIVNP